MIFVVQRLTLQAASGAELVADKVASGEWRRALEAQPQFGLIAKAFDEHVDLPSTVKSVASWLSMAAGGIVKGSIYQVLISVIGGIMLFGPCGFVLGPITLTITMVLLDQWAQRTD